MNAVESATETPGDDSSHSVGGRVGQRVHVVSYVSRVQTDRGGLGV